MQYKYATQQQDYSDYSSGRVFYSLPGHPAFPVRPASEIFQRCLAHRETIYGVSTPVTLYDPCCGAAYHLSVLAYLHGEHIREVIGSDIDEKAVAVARRNLGLLHVDGLDQRMDEITKMLEQYGKDSHQDAFRSASMFKKRLSAVTADHSLETKVFQANATDSREITNNIKARSVDIVFTDVPYGQHSEWQDVDYNSSSNPLDSILEALLGTLSSSAIVAIVSDKQQKVSHGSYERIERFQAGKRRIVILRPV
jgi:16S rRNA G966 N2-methylase RsmD